MECISQNPVLFFDSIVEYIIKDFFHIHIFHDLQTTKIKIVKIKKLRRASVNIQLSYKLVSVGKKSRKVFFYYNQFHLESPVLTLHSRLRLEITLLLHIKMITHDLNLNLNWSSKGKFTLQSDTFGSQSTRAHILQFSLTELSF